MSIPISTGSGAASVAAEEVGGLQYQRIEVLGGGGSSILGVNPDRSINVSVIGGVQVTGSIIAVGNTSVSGTVGASVIGWVPIQASNTSVITVWQNSSIQAVQAGTRITSVISSTPSSMLVGASIFGQLPAGTAPLGSVAALQGTNPWAVVNVGSIISINTGSIITTNTGSVIVVFQSSSVIAVATGSVVSVPSNNSVLTIWQSPSIVGSYAEDTAAATGDKGLFVLGVRNDTLSSVTSADGDYSSFVLGPAGEHIVANAPLTKWVQGTADMRGPATIHSVAVIAAQGASIFTYVTGVQVVNFGPSSVIVTFSGATSSVIGYTIAPAGGGSNIVYPNALKTNANGAFSASISGLASVLVSAQGFIAKI